MMINESANSLRTTNLPHKTRTTTEEGSKPRSIETTLGATTEGNRWQSGYKGKGTTSDVVTKA